MLIAGIFLILLTLEYLYFKIALHFNITDTPNIRSSHQLTTIRGGGIIFPLSIFLYYTIFGWQHLFFAAGLVALAVISFADDVKHQSRRLRAALQLIAAVFLLIEVALPVEYIIAWLAAIVIIIGMLNAYNFMDGINGMTVLYSFTVMAGLAMLNNQLHAFDNMLIICIALSNLVFGFYNCRKFARSFAGDVGSISMAYILVFLTAGCIAISRNPIFLLFYAVYLADVAITILQRLSRKEAIFEGHRKHLFQYLSNELKVPQLVVSSGYSFVQLCITIATLFIWKQPVLLQASFAVVTISFLIIFYLLCKHFVLRKIKHKTSLGIN